VEVRQNFSGPMRVEQIGQCILYCADAIEVMASLPERPSLLITDPPYKLTAGGKNTGEFRGIFATDTYNNNGKLVACDLDWSDWLSVAFNCLADDADAYVMANDKNIRDALNACHTAGFGFHNMLVWQKHNAIPTRWYMKHLEFVLYLWKGKAKTIRNPSTKQLIPIANKKECGHPTGKPTELKRLFVENSSDASDLVIDPFMGRGSCGVACAMTGRRFIGIEFDVEHFDIACRRIEQCYEMREAA
jgi:DNA modification methylase